MLLESDFQNGQNRELFNVLVQEIKAGKPADAVSIGESFPDLADHALDISANSLGSARFIRNYADQLSSRNALRRLQSVGRAIANLTHPDDAFATARRLLADCEPRVAGVGPRHISEFARMSKDGLMRRYEQDGLMTDAPITRARAAELARNLHREEEARFKASIPGVSLTQGEFDLYVDFIGQYGIGNWRGSTMRRELLTTPGLSASAAAPRYRAACDALLLYRRQAGRDCSLPQNWGPKGCKGVWTRQQERHAKCVAEQGDGHAGP